MSITRNVAHLVISGIVGSIGLVAVTNLGVFDLLKARMAHVNDPSMAPIVQLVGSLDKNAHAFVDFDVTNTEQLVQLATPKNLTDLLAKLCLLIFVLNLYSAILAFANGFDRAMEFGVKESSGFLKETKTYRDTRRFVVGRFAKLKSPKKAD